MTVRRWLAVLLAMLLLTGCTIREKAVPEGTVSPAYAPADMTQEETTSPAYAPADMTQEETASPAYVSADMTQEEIQHFIETLFAAAAGTTDEQEKEIRKDMTEAELEARSAASAEYRAKTLPWLTAAFRPDVPSEELVPISDELSALEPPQEPAAASEGEEAEPPVYTAQDSYAVFRETEAGTEYLTLLESMGGDSRETCLLITQEICGMWMAQVNHEALADMNGDYRCWIYAPDTQIDYPVVQSGDNSYYLKRLFNGARNSAGTLFIDYRNLPGFQDPNTLIYGHHMRNDSMFGSLTDYAEQAYYEGHPVLLVMAADEIFLLEVFAGYTTSDKDHCYDIAISDEEDMAAFIDEAVRKSDFVSGVQVKTTDTLVTLSTCAYAFEDARYILIGRIVPVWSAETDNAEQADQGD